MSKGNHRLPAWLAGITTLLATAGVASAGTYEPDATHNGASAATQDCTSVSDRSSERCDESAQNARDERDRAVDAKESSANDADDHASSNDSQSGSERVVRHSPDETPQTRVVPPAHATRMPANSTGSSTTAGTVQSGQYDERDSSTGANAGYANSRHPQNDANSRDADRTHESGNYDEDEDEYTNDTANSPSNAADRAESIANEQDEHSTRSVPPEHATRMPETNDSSSYSNTAENERANRNSNSDSYRSDDEAGRSTHYASRDEERESGANGSAMGIARIQSQFDSLDTDHDGTIDAAEASVSSTLRAQFFTLDTNGDGKLSMSEFKTASDIASIRADRHDRRQ